jgi:hypothetical protein
MRLKKIALILSSLLLAIGIFSCVEEPTVEAPARPFAVIRIGNFSANVANLAITIDGQSPVADLSDLAYQEVTPFFDVIAGQRLITIVDKATNDTIYNKEINFSSYNEVSCFFTGEYSTVDTLNNFNYASFAEGLTYYDNSPVQGKAYVSFLYLITQALNHLTDQPRIDVYDGTAGKDSLIIEDFNKDEGFNDVRFTDASVGGRKFVFKKLLTTDVVASDSVQIQAGKRYLFVLTGNAINPGIMHLENDPLPVRGK